MRRTKWNRSFSAVETLHVESIANSQKNLLNAFAQIWLRIIQSTETKVLRFGPSFFLKIKIYRPWFYLAKFVRPPYFHMNHANFDQALFFLVSLCVDFRQKKQLNFWTALFFRPFCLVISIGWDWHFEIKSMFILFISIWMCRKRSFIIVYFSIVIFRRFEMT